MGSGKSTIGRALASRLHTEFFDTDAWIEVRESRSIARIFEESGESYFREREVEALEAACRKPSVVVATGGGLFAQAANRERIRVAGRSVWLDTPLERIWERGRESTERPLWGSPDELRRLLEERMPAYRQADWRIEVGDRGIDEIVELLERMVVPGDKEV